MNRVLLAVFAILLLCGSLLGQSPAPSSATAQAAATTAPAASAPRIAPGSVIPVQLLKSIDAKKAKSGDEVIAKVTQDIRNNAGTLVVPKDTKILGHVTEAQARSKEQKESHLTIVFDHAVLKNGEQVQLHMSIQAIVAPPNPFPATANLGTERSSSYPGTPSPLPPAQPPQRRGEGLARCQASHKQPAACRRAPEGQPAITGKTQGVVGISNLKLSAASDPAQGSLVSSDKENVKLENDTYLLLRVNQ